MGLRPYEPTQQSARRLPKTQRAGPIERAGSPYMCRFALEVSCGRQGGLLSPRLLTGGGTVLAVLPDSHKESK